VEESRKLENYNTSNKEKYKKICRVCVNKMKCDLRAERFDFVATEWEQSENETSNNNNNNVLLGDAGSFNTTTTESIIYS